MEVWTLELVVLLYLHRVSTTHPLVAARQASLQSLTNDPWPGANSQNTRKQLLEEQNADFIKESLPELLSLLSGNLQLESSKDKKKKVEKKSGRELLCFMKTAGVLSTDIVEALGIIIGGHMKADSTERPLLSLATNKQTCYESGYLSKKNAFQKGLFEQWVLRGLDWAPHGEWLCVRKGRRESWPIGSLLNQSNHRIASSPPGR